MMGCIPTVLSLLHRRQILEGLIAFALLILERCASIIESHRHMHGIAERLVRRATTTAKVVLSLNLIASHAVVLQMATFGYSDDGILAEWNASLDDIGVVLDDGWKLSPPWQILSFTPLVYRNFNRAETRATASRPSVAKA